MRASFLILVLGFLSCCGQQLPPVPGNVKVYEMREDKGGLLRLQAKDPVLAFNKASGYLCASPKHFGDIVGCVGGAVRVYELQPSRGGIYRAQANDLMTYAEAQGYICTSPKDFNYILDKCI